MDLDLDLFRTRGRATRAIAAEVVRELTPADAAMTQVEKGSTPSPLKRIGERHHSLARLLAAGVGPGKAAVAVGLAPSRVSILQADPTFRELMEFYRENVDAIYADLHTRLAGMSADAAEELRRRLEEEPDDLTVNALTELVKLGADRTGYGPTTKSDVRVVHDIADRLQAARERHAKIIEGKVDAED